MIGSNPAVSRIVSSIRSVAENNRSRCVGAVLQNVLVRYSLGSVLGNVT